MNAFRSVLLGLTLIFCPPLAAQTPLGAIVKQATTDGTVAAAIPAGPVAADDLKQRLSDAQAELAAVDSPERLAAGAPPATPATQLQQRARMLRLMAFAYRQHLSALGSLAEQRKLAADAEAKRRAWPGFAAGQPISILLADKLRTELQASLLNLRSEENRLKILAAQMEITRDNLARAGERHRLAQEVLEAAKPAEIAAAGWQRDLAALEVRAFGAYLEALAAQSRAVEATVAEFGQVVDFERRKIAEAEKSVAFQPADLERLKLDIDERRSTISKELDGAGRERERASAELDRAIDANAAAEQQAEDLQRRLAEGRKAVLAAEAEVAKAENPEGFLRKANPFRGSSARAELEQRRTAVGELEKQLAAARALAPVRERELLLAIERSRNAAQVVDALNIGLVALDMRRTFWDLRYAAFDREQARTLDRRRNHESSRRLLRLLDPSIDYLREKLEIVVGQLAEQQNLLRAAGDAAETAFRKRLLELLAERERRYLATFSEVEETRHLLLRWVEDEAMRTKEQSADELARNRLDLAEEWLKAAWTFELFVVEDSIVVDGRSITGSRGITVAKVVSAILIVVVGYLLVALLTGLLMASLLRRGRMDETSARIARKWILAVTLVVLLLMALDVVKIPLAAFAFLGGAIAIGAGFGMQTLLKNLISGVMLLMERPFKPRDIVEVGGIRGEVTDINVRSCTIRDVNGIETLVPNSTFLEQNVTNWTLSNRRVRYTLNVGVGYGSPVRRVSDLLLEVAGRHKLVLADPAPEVLFMDFGDNALLFALYVWLEVGPDRRSGNLVLSDLRFMIDASFAEQGIAIPFPQRDVHLAADSPLPVRVVPPESSATR